MPNVAHPLSAVLLACLLCLNAAASMQQPSSPGALRGDWPTSSSGQAVLPAVAPSAADAPAAGEASPLPAPRPTVTSWGGAAAAPSALAPVPGQPGSPALLRRSSPEDAVFTQGMLPLDNHGRTVRALCTFPCYFLPVTCNLSLLRALQDINVPQRAET